jgi:hypothetical protein
VKRRKFKKLLTGSRARMYELIPSSPDDLLRYNPEARFIKEAVDRSGIEKFRTIVLYSALGLGTATGLVLLIRHFYKKEKGKVTASKSLEEGNPATYARQLGMAILGVGTDEDAIFKVFNEIPSKAMYKKVQAAYTSLYGNELTTDLEDDLASSDYNELIRIISLKKER